MPKKYTTLFFDLDNTLLDFHKSENTAIKQVLRQNDLPCDEETARLYSAINQTYWERFERGEMTKSEILVNRFKTLLEKIDRQGNPEKISKEYFLALSCGYDLIDGAMEVLERIKKAGYIICATTNGVSLTQYKRIKNSGLEKYFDYVFVSEDTGYQKPAKEYFDYAVANSTEKDKSKILIIGDSQSSDILGGINSGIDTCWYNPKGESGRYESTYTVLSLFEICDILEV